ncbi:MAG: hypothetical protein HDR17_05840 [Lachnospiraceae bacterium]|nr:hypothetical protein [Lachnospiraceae bacterium]
MSVSVTEYIDSFIVDVNNTINWKYLKSRRVLKKEINDIVFQVDFYSSKFNSTGSRIEIKSECRVWCRKYDKSLTVKSGIADIAFMEDKGCWWDIRDADNRNTVLHSLLQEINAKVIRFTMKMENDFKSGLLNLICDYGFSAYSNSMQYIDETFGREEVLAAANEYMKNMSVSEQKMIGRFMNGENDLVNERNLRYMIDYHLIDTKDQILAGD